MKRIIPILFIAAAFCLSIFSCKHDQVNNTEETVDSEWKDSLQHVYEYGICIDSLNVEHFEIRNGDNPSIIFSRLGFSALEADSISKASASVLDPTRIKAGMHYCTFTTRDSIAKIQYIAFAKTMTDYAIIDLRKRPIEAYTFNKPITLKRKSVNGTITSSLWNIIKQQGADPLLAIKIADVFAWEIDFFDVKEGDSFQVIYNEAYIDDTTALSISSIEGALFTHQGKDYYAIPFLQDSSMQFFDLEGNSLRKAFLKAPLDFYRITSRFTNARFHPILKRYRAHHGVDYAAPTGTPVRTIGDGSVIFKGYTNGGGHTIKIKHNSVYTTSYMHLSRYAKGLSVGQRVKQGEEIGYVGSTGLSTGPHLDFRVYKNGEPINPLDMEAPPSEPIKPELRDSFNIVKNRIISELDSLKNLKLNNQELTLAK